MLRGDGRGSGDATGCGSEQKMPPRELATLHHSSLFFVPYCEMHSFTAVIYYRPNEQGKPLANIVP